MKPSWRAITRAATARRNRSCTVVSIERSPPASRPPAGMDRHHPGAQDAEVDLREACLLHLAGQARRIGEPPDALDQIAIGLAIAGDDLAQCRDCGERIEI